MSNDLVVPSNYGDVLEQIKTQVRAARIQAARAVNTELICLYWSIGSLILERQAAQGWGAKVIDRLATDLRAEFPKMRGFSARNLVYMRTFASSFAAPIAQQPAAQLPWGHIMVILDKVNDPQAQAWYTAQAVQHGWSRAVLSHHIASDRYRRVGAAVHNFPATLPPEESDLAREIVADPYDLEFLRLGPGYSERELEDALVERLANFITELGAGFLFVGRQYPLVVGGQEFYIDLLFFHLGLRRFIIFELKNSGAKPEHLGKLNFYVDVVDDLLRRPEHDDGPTIGILLVASRNDIVVEYALHGYQTPMAVSTYTHQGLPDEIRTALPTPADLADIVRETRQKKL